MADYQLTNTNSVIRTSDGATIPNDDANRDWVEYQDWLSGGGVPDPYVEPEPAPAAPTLEQQIMYDHENRLRTIEGVPLLTIDDFMKHAGRQQ